MRFRLLTILMVVTVMALGLGLYRHYLDRNAAIEQAVEAIDAFDERSDNPIELWELLASLQELGQTDAVEALRRFNSQDRYSSKLRVIIPMIFQRRNASEKYPIRTFDRQNQSYELAIDDWGQLDYELRGDIPFRTNCLVVASSSMGLDECYLIDWADQNGLMRTDPLSPSNDPFLHADKLIDELVKREEEMENQPNAHLVNSFRESITNSIHQQVYSMIDHLISEESLFRSNRLPDAAQLWSRIRTRCANNALKWDPKTNRYRFDVSKMP